MKTRFASLLTLLLIPAVFVGCSDDNVAAPIADTTPPLAPIVKGARADDATIGVWWESNIEADLAGYNVYSIENGVARKINVGPINQTYVVYERHDQSSARIYVTATDWSGNESGPSRAHQVRVTTDSPVIPNTEKTAQF